MTIKIIAVTKPLDEEQSVADFVAYVARVSNPSNQNNQLTANRLLAYLVKHAHWSPFEMVNIVVEINTTRDISRQILRHRSFSFQEFSGRYADPTAALGYSRREARLQDDKNRQNSVELDEDSDLHDEWWEQQQHVMVQAQQAYDWAMEKGIAKEQARVVLPEGLINTRLYMNGTLRSWIHYCQLRSANGTQKEHQEIAIAIWQEIVKVFPALEGIISE